MKEQEIRKSFIEFFKEKGHTIVPSAPLTPDDPTLLFTTAGMVQFKKLWTGSPDSEEISLPYKRALSIQKCLRASDLENVGKKARYHTFFEMLGNFSFGDYFKEEAIQWAWEYFTKILNLPVDKLYISVLKGDDESYKIWKNIVGKSRVFELGEENNFWKPVGGSGACGPCTEIYYDVGEELGCDKPGCEPGCDCDRFIEIWNLVFPQYDSQPDGSLKPLKNRGVDTGMGFERLCMVAQNKKSPFELDLFQPIIKEAEKLCNLRYSEERIFFNIIADHIRALVFSIAEGIYPSNIGRGYLLRHILRRAQTMAYERGIKTPFLYKLVPVVIDIMKEPYPENVNHREGVALVVKSEEESFLRTIEQGTKIFYATISELSGEPVKSNIVPGEIIFKLYDTYGFPPELTYELTRQRGKTPDQQGFEKIMEKAREKAKSASKFVGTNSIRAGAWNEIIPINTTEFTGYENLKTYTQIAKWRQNETQTELILDKTPFYGESGGQVGDTGKIYNDEFEFEVTGTYIVGARHAVPLHIHSGKIIKGNISNKQVICEVDSARRKAIARNHTATHLLHSALRKVLGKWVHQQGSLVEPEQFRFDFTHFNPLTPHELEKIEALVNDWIDNDIKMNIFETTFEEAVKIGATALFGEKYGKTVRVVKIGDISAELCGGTHLSSTGDIRIFKILAEGSIHAGVRRISAITGVYAVDWFKNCEKHLNSIAQHLVGADPRVCPIFDTEKKVIELLQKEKDMRDKILKLERTSILTLVPEIIAKKQEVNGIEILTSEVPTDNEEILRSLADKLRTGEKRAGVIGTVLGRSGPLTRPFFVTFVSDDLKEKLKASEIAKEVGKLAGGGGGGKPAIGQAGGSPADGGSSGKPEISVKSILSTVPELIKRLLDKQSKKP